jgi:hypothetical protein
MIDRETYSVHLMAALERAQNLDCIIEIDSAVMEFCVIFRTTGAVHRVQFEDDGFMSDEYLQELEIAVGNLEFNNALEAELQATRERALAKLTELERAVLGL